MLEMGITLEEYHFSSYYKSHHSHTSLEANQLACLYQRT
jgi:hypothetical protein